MESYYATLQPSSDGTAAAHVKQFSLTLAMRGGPERVTRPQPVVRVRVQVPTLELMTEETSIVGWRTRCLNGYLLACRQR